MSEGVKLAQTCPRFMFGNSTSHTWIFSAVAELIDNAYDPDVRAKRIEIEKETIHDMQCLIFQDNGNGMEPEKLFKMLGLGFCEKEKFASKAGYKPIGAYGNGFKSGSMRLGRDAVVFTKTMKSFSVGFYSQTYLKSVRTETVLIPMVTWDCRTDNVKDSPDNKASLHDIIKHSIFQSEPALLHQFAKLNTSKTGTRIVIYNLKTGSDGRFEMDFESNPHDIINSEHHELDFGTTIRPVREYMSEYRRSLRPMVRLPPWSTTTDFPPNESLKPIKFECLNCDICVWSTVAGLTPKGEYLSILYLKPRMKIILRGQKVKTKLVSKCLSKTEADVYKPLWLERSVKIIFGFGPSDEDYGIMMYHRNRLIKAFERVGIQKQGGDQGKGVVGVVELDFLDPIHNKQDFNKTDRFNACMGALGSKLTDYYNEKVNANPAGDTQQALLPDWTWVQCDSCLKWRRLPDHYTSQDLPEQWTCMMNPDPTHSRCDIEEEPEDEDDVVRKTYEKTYKRQVERRKRNTIQQQERALKEKEHELSRVKQQIKQLQLQQPLEEVTSSEDNKPTVADLQKAQTDLMQAKRREEQQRRLIVKLQSQQSDIHFRQNRLRNAMREEAAQLQALYKQSKKTLSSVITIDDDNISSTSGDKRPIDVDEEDYVITENGENGEVPVASTSRPANKRARKTIVGGGASSANAIVLDSDDDDNYVMEVERWSRPPADVKPNVEELDKAISNSTRIEFDDESGTVVVELNKDVVTEKTDMQQETETVMDTSTTAAVEKDKCTSTANAQQSKKAHTAVSEKDNIEITIKTDKDASSTSDTSTTVAVEKDKCTSTANAQQSKKAHTAVSEKYNIEITIKTDKDASSTSDTSTTVAVEKDKCTSTANAQQSKKSGNTVSEKENIETTLKTDEDASCTTEPAKNDTTKESVIQDPDTSHPTRQTEEVENTGASDQQNRDNSNTADKTKNVDQEAKRPGTAHKNIQTTPVKFAAGDSNKDKTDSKEVTQLKATLKDTADKLYKLRQNAAELLKIIVPELNIEDISDLDEMLRQVIQINTQQETTAEVKEETKET